MQREAVIKMFMIINVLSYNELTVDCCLGKILQVCLLIKQYCSLTEHNFFFIFFQYYETFLQVFK